jgi:hypothetical protein
MLFTYLFKTNFEETAAAWKKECAKPIVDEAKRSELRAKFNKAYGEWLTWIGMPFGFRD